MPTADYYHLLESLGHKLTVESLESEIVLKHTSEPRDRPNRLARQETQAAFDAGLNHVAETLITSCVGLGAVAQAFAQVGVDAEQATLTLERLRAVMADLEQQVATQIYTAQPEKPSEPTVRRGINLRGPVV